MPAMHFPGAWYRRSAVAIILIGCISLSSAFTQTHPKSRQSCVTSAPSASLSQGFTNQLQAVRIWMEEAEKDFVDHDENLEEGEECLRSLKAFASNPDDPTENRFLSAGALVRRPPPATNSNLSQLQLYGAWIGDSMLDDGGPNLQKIGALKIVDALFLDHLKRHQEDPIRALRSFLIQCNEDSDFTCASYRAILDRGFRPMQKILKAGNTIYNSHDYDCDVQSHPFLPVN